MYRVRLSEALIKTPKAIGNVGKYHAPFRLAYERIITERGGGTSVGVFAAYNVDDMLASRP